MATTAHIEQIPPTRVMLENHELAFRTISGHGTPLAIFDQDELQILRQFVVDPSEQNKSQVLSQAARGDIYDGPDVDGDTAGAQALKHGSLAGYVVARYGKADSGTLNLQEIEALREWFASGGGQE